MKRRDLIAGALIAITVRRARAQQTNRLRRIGVFSPVIADQSSALFTMKQALRELGWAEGRSFEIDFRGGAANPDQERALARELVNRSPDVILAVGVPGLVPLVRETSTIPIVFVFVSDPVGQGFVASLARPGGNVTGFTNFEFATAGKWLELLKEVAPRLARFAVLYNPTTAPYTEAFLPSLRSSAASFGAGLTATLVYTDADIELAIAGLGGEAGVGLIVPPDAFTYRARDLIVELVARHRVPAIYAFHDFTAGGGLLSYSGDVVDQFRQAAVYIDRILKGTRPADLPVQQPTKFGLAINLKTAKTLGLTIPPSLLARADEVIE